MQLRLEGLLKSISGRWVGKLLRRAAIRPHKNKYWLTSKDKTDPNFDERVADICGAYREAISLYKTRGIHTICIDEQTGIQALERIAPDRGVGPGEYLFEVVMRRHELRSTMMTSNRPLEEWGKLIGDVPSAPAIIAATTGDKTAFSGWPHRPETRGSSTISEPSLSLGAQKIPGLSASKGTSCSKEARCLSLRGLPSARKYRGESTGDG